MQRAIFFDRDGVINPLIVRPDGRNTSPWSIDEFVLFPRVQEAFALIAPHYKCFVVTNQPHVGHEMTNDDMVAINAQLKYWVPEICEIAYCSVQGSSHYKPNHGMVLDLVSRHKLCPLMQYHYMIGDRWKDIVCGHNAGTCTIFVGSKYVCGEYPYQDILPDYQTLDIYDACRLIMEQTI
jgi:D-glycero-D-manno-heptose 1,7-bisphosphate phosphatase